MSNSIIRQATNTPWRYAFSWGLIVLIGFAIVMIWSRISTNFWLNHTIQARQDTLNAVEEEIKRTGSEKTFFAYKFANDLNNTSTKRSAHITALVEVLRQVQDNSYIWSNALTLSDFTITPESLSLKWTATNLLLIYYSSQANNYTGLIDRFTALNFIENIAINQYNKIWNSFEFTLDADINPNAILPEPEPIIPTTTVRDTQTINGLDSNESSDTSLAADPNNWRSDETESNDQ